MVPTAERRTTTVKADVDDRIPSAVSLAARRRDPRLPADRCRARPDHAAAGDRRRGRRDDADRPRRARSTRPRAGPRRLIMQRHTTHYAAYDRYWDQVTPRSSTGSTRTCATAASWSAAATAVPTPSSSERNAEHEHRSADRRRHGRHARRAPVDADVLVDGRQDRGHRQRRRSSARTSAARSTRPASSVLPGMVDVHVHTREPGFTHKEDITTTAWPGRRRRRDDDLRDAQPATRRPSSAELLDEVFERYAPRSRSWTTTTTRRPTDPDEIVPMAETRHPRLQDLHGRRHRPHLPASGGHGHARPRRPAAR